VILFTAVYATLSPVPTPYSTVLPTIVLTPLFFLALNFFGVCAQFLMLDRFNVSTIRKTIAFKSEKFLTGYPDKFWR